jgi:hypothetical protein
MNEETAISDVVTEDVHDMIRMNLEISDHLLELALSEAVEVSPAADALIRSARRYVSDIQKLISQK